MKSVLPTRAALLLLATLLITAPGCCHRGYQNGYAPAGATYIPAQGTTIVPGCGCGPVSGVPVTGNAYYSNVPATSTTVVTSGTPTYSEPRPLTPIPSPTPAGSGTQ